MEEKIGKVFKYFKEPSVAAIKIERGELSIGDKVRFEGENTDFEQEIQSMEIEGEEVEEVGPGDDVGIKVKERVRPNDEVIKLD
ncbi:MAG: translation elongation factor-like protein [Candidatus Thermoplasmatota archaeon]|nr:translation elongation factor-like protein [Candidatus Thermoplasmatota archaeon]MBS3790179.1 translation elongation factor-like protein [Candidatus Thermoplasmatota archaeon]